ncbi:hypothetical protein [Streptomyces sp. NPDC048516]|uniref:aromatic-ring hydroxylase C-terminal domain-containing protein n=1 Tax=Streptomyces sp. NPDC048516 TaxID=3365565 RepID=UPI003720A676
MGEAGDRTQRHRPRLPHRSGRVREILVRPDGHIAWATRSTDVHTRRSERFRALTSWAGRPAAD